MRRHAPMLVLAIAVLASAPALGQVRKPPAKRQPMPTLADCLAGAKTSGEIRKAAMQLRIAAPIHRWDEAIPLGNGLMGGLLYGDGSQLKLSLDRGDLWDERPSPRVLQKDFTWKHWLELREAGRWAELGELFDKPYSHPTPTKIPGGRLELTLDPSQTVAAFSLDLACAAARAELTGGQGAVECFYSATDGVVLLRIPGPKPVAWRFVPPAVLQQRLGYPPPEINDTGDVRWFVQAVPEGLKYAAVAAQRATDRGTLIALTITATTTDGPDPLASGRARIARAMEIGYDRLLAAHTVWWKKFWATSEVFVPDELQLLHYNLMRYLLGAGSRLGAPPMPLQGVWTADGGLPPWKGDYHHDLNTQMMYASYLAAGHFDEGRCFLEFMWDRLPTFRKFAREFYGTPGAMFPSVMSAAGTALCGWPMYALMPQGNGSWVGWMFYRHWLYTRDEAFLRDRAYPFCAELGECLAALLKPDAQGILKMPISSSPEINDNRPQAYLTPNTNYDRDSMAALFGGLAHMAEVLGKADDAARWRKIATSLGPRWFDPETKELGFTIGMPFNQSHRHMSHLMSIHPYGQLNVDGPAPDRQVIAASLAALDRFGPGVWCGYSQSWAACLRARAADAEGALRHMQAFCGEFTSRNGFHLNGNQKGGPGWGNGARPFTLEGNFIAMEAVHDMLLQGWGGVVRLFPATPAAWADAEFRDLWAEGGWKVSAERKAGKVTRLEITATAGGKLCLLSPWTAIQADGRSLQPDARGIVEVSTTPGQRCVFTPR